MKKKARLQAPSPFLARAPLPSHANGFIPSLPAVSPALRARRRRGRIARRLGGPPC